jgi:hypothetical protein
MMRSRRSSVVAVIAALALATPALAASSPYDPHLDIVAFDPLGDPGTGFNSEIVIDTAADFAYVGALFGDNSVKAVDVSDPANPLMTAAVAVEGDPFDVKVAGDVLAASTQEFEGLLNPGITLMDITDRANPIVASHLGGAAQLDSPAGSHNSFLWEDPLDGDVWLFATGLDFISLKIFDVTDPYNPVLVAEYDNGLTFPDPEGDVPVPYVHDNFVQENDGRVFEYQAGVIGVEILDVTRIVRGGESGQLTSDDLVGKNHYTLGFGPDADTVTRPHFTHYIEPTASGDVVWVGDEEGCFEPGIIRAFDASALPMPGEGAMLLEEIGTIIDNPDSATCNSLHRSEQGFEHGNSIGQLQEYRHTGHNFDLWGDDLLIRGDYGRGVAVWDVSDPGAAQKVAAARGMNLGVGEANRAVPGRGFLESYPLVWQAVYDGDLIYASDIVQGLYILDLVGD